MRLSMPSGTLRGGSAVVVDGRTLAALLTRTPRRGLMRTPYWIERSFATALAGPRRGRFSRSLTPIELSSILDLLMEGERRQQT
jgi:hypothetical protein